MLGGAPSVSWHFDGVGPVVTDDVVADSQPTPSAIAKIEVSTDKYLHTWLVEVIPSRDAGLVRIEASQRTGARFRLVHTVRQPAVEVSCAEQAV
jgi:hypothetical protein